MSNKKSLHHATVIISFRAANFERLQNLTALINHFALTYVDYSILIVEGDESSKIPADILNQEHVTHHFIHAPDLFPKSLLYNTGVKLAQSELIIFHDCDMIVHPDAFMFCIEEAFKNPLLAICPFLEIINVSGAAKKEFIANPIYDYFSSIDRHDLPVDYVVMAERCVGGVTVLMRHKIIEMGGMNTRIVGWGSEDGEFCTRWTRAGFSWLSIDVPVFHLHHDAAKRDDWRITHQAQHNLRLEHQSMNMTETELAI